MKTITKTFVLSFLFSICLIFDQVFAWAQASLPPAFREQASISIRYMLNNISRADGAPGSVVAAPSKSSPNYYYHWVRDAALVMETVLALYRQAEDPGLRKQLLAVLKDYVGFSARNQRTPNRSGGLGEPRFHVDGSADDADWGRPQNDGPALRAGVLAELAFELLRSGQEAYVRTVLYDGKLPTQSVVKMDLEYVAHRWMDTNFDLWEEVRGHHFYTFMVQRRALILGAKLALRLGDEGAARFYVGQAQRIEGALRQFWNPEKGYLLATMNRDGGLDYKQSGLDTSTILGILHGYADDGFLAPSNDLILATALKLHETFGKIYPINQNQMVGMAIGRYPEDRYDGNGFSGGNPWALLTHAFAELFFKAAHIFSKMGEINITAIGLPFWKTFAPEVDVQVGETISTSDGRFRQLLMRLHNQGDRFLQRTLLHRHPDGSLSEQINRFSGYMQGAPNLTWSHASFLSAIQAR